MIFVDTSVWVDFFHGRQESGASTLSELLDQDRVGLPVPVYLELLSGASQKDFETLRRVLRALPIYRPTPRTWTQLEAWTRTAVEAGERFGFGDLLIAAIATEAGGKVWSFDRDFERMEKLGFVQLH